ncbi:MAG: hypothetical protein M5U28_37635 [Sandaracinaceae bacterium]|nr:hypothetical protein [Sandaracinaceae bacterium]
MRALAQDRERARDRLDLDLEPERAQVLDDARDQAARRVGRVREHDGLEGPHLREQRARGLRVVRPALCLLGRAAHVRDVRDARALPVDLGGEPLAIDRLRDGAAHLEPPEQRVLEVRHEQHDRGRGPLAQRAGTRRQRRLEVLALEGVGLRRVELARREGARQRRGVPIARHLHARDVRRRAQVVRVRLGDDAIVVVRDDAVGADAGPARRDHPARLVVALGGERLGDDVRGPELRRVHRAREALGPAQDQRAIVGRRRVDDRLVGARLEREQEVARRHRRPVGPPRALADAPGHLDLPAGEEAQRVVADAGHALDEQGAGPEPHVVVHGPEVGAAAAGRPGDA